jgi:cell shape-determining protein MreD
MRVLAWVLLVGTVIASVAAQVWGFINDIVYTNYLSEVALFFGAFVAVRQNRTPKEVVAAVVQHTEISAADPD